MLYNRAVRLGATIVSSILYPSLVFAQIPKQIVSCNGAVAGNGLPACSICHIAELAQNLLNTGIYLAVFLTAILFAWAGWKYITAGGDSGQAGEAKKIFWTVGIGLIIILSAWLVVDLIMKMLVKPSAPWGPWNSICP